MSLFETEVAEASRSFISTMNVMEANREAAYMVEQLGNLLRDAGIANHATLVVHAHYMPTKIDYRILIYRRADGLQRIFEMVGAVVTTKGGYMKLCDEGHYKKKTVFLELPDLHVIDLDFESDDITREMLDEAIKGGEQ
jgi:hypothetical protein